MSGRHTDFGTSVISTVSLYSRIADLPLRIAGSERSRQVRGTSSGFDRHTTTFHLHGEGQIGRGEDVCYEATDHESLATAGSFDFAGDWTMRSFSTHLNSVDLFPNGSPSSEAARNYRRWALESAGLDLALRQAETSLGDRLGRSYDPVRFVVSTRLSDGNPDRVQELLAIAPTTEFKLDPTTEWTDETITTVAETGAVRILDLKGQYDDFDADQLTSAEQYRDLLSTFSNTIIEDPAVTAETRPILTEIVDRLSWDAPITGKESVKTLPYEPAWLNIKPSRFGTIESLLTTIEYCEESDISMYGGGQFELDVGRDHIQAMASLFYPQGPNDVAPGSYNEPTVPSDPPPSPLEIPEYDRGLGGE